MSFRALVSPTAGIASSSSTISSMGRPPRAMAHLVEREQEPVQDVAPVLHVRPRERPQESDLDRRLRSRLTGGERGAGREAQRQQGQQAPVHSLPRRAISAWMHSEMTDQNLA